MKTLQCRNLMQWQGRSKSPKSTNEGEERAPGNVMPPPLLGLEVPLKNGRRAKDADEERELDGGSLRYLYSSRDDDGRVSHDFTGNERMASAGRRGDRLGEELRAFLGAGR